MFATCYTDNNACFNFDNAACETIRNAPKGRRCLVSRDRRTCEGLDEFWWGYTTECRDVPARAEFLVDHARTLTYTARVALREASRNSMSKLAAAAIKGAAHAARSARAKRAWETRRRNAARTAEILSATCEPLVVDADALPPSVSCSATPGSECCYGRAAHGTCGRVVAAWLPWTGTASTMAQYCALSGAARLPKCPHVVPCDPRDTRAVMFDILCRTPAEGRRERRNARRRELYRLRKAA